MRTQDSGYSQIGSLRALREARMVNGLAREKARESFECRVVHLFSLTTVLADVVNGVLPEWTRHFASRLFRG